jgi:cytohesin
MRSENVDSNDRGIFVSCSYDIVDVVSVVESIVADLNRFLPQSERWRVYHWEGADIKFDSNTTWQTQIQRPSSEQFQILLSFFGERVGSALPSNFPLETARDLPGWLKLAPNDSDHDVVPLTGTLFEFYDWPKEHNRKHYIFFKADQDTLRNAQTPRTRNFGFKHHLSAIRGNKTDIDENLENDYRLQETFLDIFYRNEIQKNGLPYICYGPIGAEDPLCHAGLGAALKRVLSGAFGIQEDQSFWPKGLKSYQEEDVRFLFGRDDDISSFWTFAERQLSDKSIRSTIILTGRSGVGKSSFLRAGILGGLNAKLSRRSKAFVPLVMLPNEICDADPILAFARLLDEKFGAGQTLSLLAAELRREVRGARIVSAITDLLERRKARLFVALDQAEEILFAQPHDRAMADRTSELWQLLDELSARKLALIVVTIPLEHRDQMGVIASAFGNAVDFRLNEPGLEQIRIIVERTLATIDASDRSPIIDRIVADAERWLEGRKPGPLLPLLSATLREWLDQDRARRREALITRRDVDTSPEVPSLSAIIENIGNAAWTAAMAHRRIDVRQGFHRMMRRLVGFTTRSGKDDEVILPILEEIRRDDPVFELAPGLLRELLKNRLLYAPQESTIRLSHESILFHWSKAKSWMSEERRLTQSRRLIDELRSQDKRGRLGKLDTDEICQLELAWEKLSEELDEGRLEFIRSQLLKTVSEEHWLEAKKLRRHNRFAAALKIDDDRYAQAWCDQIGNGYWLDLAGAILGFDENGHSMLAVAVARGKLEQVRWLLQRKRVNPDFSTTRGWRPLHFAAQSGHADIASCLIEIGADVDATTSNGWTALHQAAFNGHADVVAVLLASGADATQRTDDGDNPLHSAAYNGFLGICRMLIEATGGSLLDIKSKKSWTALHQACANGHYELAVFLTKQGASIELAGARGRTSLHWAAMHDHADILKYLLEIPGATPNLGSQTDGWMPLHSAIPQSSAAVVRLLLEHGADVRQSVAAGASPLHIAVVYARLDLAPLLLAHGADVNARSKSGSTPLHDAVEMSDLQFARWLVTHGADPDAAKTEGWTPLHTAAGKGDIRMVTLLLDAGGNANAVRPKNNETVLHRATDQGRLDVVQLLLDKGSDVACVNQDGWTPLHQAMSRGRKDLAELLLARGADQNASTRNGMKPLDVATERCRQWLLGLGATSGRDRPRDSTLPILHKAAIDGDDEAVREHLAARHGLYDQNDLGWTTLHSVANSERLQPATRAFAAAFLLDAGVDATARTPKGLTALHIAVRSGCRPLVDALAASHESIALTTNKGLRALHFAALAGRVDLAAVLIAAGADPLQNSTPTETGFCFSPATVAFAFERQGLIKTLEQAGKRLRRPDPQEIAMFLREVDVSLDTEVVAPREVSTDVTQFEAVKNLVRSAEPANLEDWLEVFRQAVVDVGGKPTRMLRRFRKLQSAPPVKLVTTEAYTRSDERNRLR